MLPTPAQPTFNDVLPDGTEFKFRPFNVDEQKNILIAAQGGDEKSTLENLVALVGSCTFGKFDFLDRPVADFEKAFLAVRGKSVGEVIEINWSCMNIVDERPCNHQNNTDINFLNETKFTEGEPDLIDIDDTIKLKLKPLTMRDVINVGEKTDDIEFVYSKVEYLVQGETFYTEFTLDEFKEFMSKISTEANNKIVLCYANYRRGVLDVKTRCKKCGSSGLIHVEGVLHFFG